MAPRHSPSQSPRQKRFLICLLLLFTPFLLFVISVKHQTHSVSTHTHEDEVEEVKISANKPAWFDIIAKGISQSKIKVAFVNIIDYCNNDNNSLTHHQRVESVTVNFDRVDENLKWDDFFPKRIDEEGKRGQLPKCPHVPMPLLESYHDLNVVVAKVPCNARDVFRLQVNLVVANLAVKSGLVGRLEVGYRYVYVVFEGDCGPMEEIFRCDDLLLEHHQEGGGGGSGGDGGYWVYKPDLRSLKHKMLMPIGTCQIAPGYAETGREIWRWFSRMHQTQDNNVNNNNNIKPAPKLAYVTILHSSEAHVCGAIALAQSIILSNQNNLLKHHSDLLLLADDSISPESIAGLRAAGWKIRRIRRIATPFAKRGAYNEWSYSKLRIWQLTEYQKVIFIDAHLVVLQSIDHLFYYPQLSAAPNGNALFDSGLMVIEPSQCMFDNMMQKVSQVRSYNGGEQGFLNEIFIRWQRMPSKLNHLKSFRSQGGSKERHEVPEDLYAIHYLGLKPWMCYRDYDCNWDMPDHHIFASDSAHRRWWEVYDAMPEELQSYCGITKKMNERIVKRRREARNASLPDGHWKIEVKDPRRKHYSVD